MKDPRWFPRIAKDADLRRPKRKPAPDRKELELEQRGRDFEIVRDLNRGER